MKSLKIIVLAAIICESLAFVRLEGMDSNHNPALRNSAEFLREAQKRSEANVDGDLLCYGCRNTDPTSNSCVGRVEACQSGEVCASVFHADNTNLDGCLAATICDHLMKSDGIYARCCSTNFCNM
ncbi:hypothetical protein ElyMa_003909200 [Elysia marginata]|uniref:UPAR/Ly6 domain-containing protein n=1 Tax=Elysia marginata TaxID=1093978 RepID=A0AAV4FPX7_9GAST|nr:hypothetical protein ElyMa_003909200 [Elysia marginata]